MTEEVWLIIIGEQISPEGEKERNQTKCRARYRWDKEQHVLEYEERGEEGEKPTQSRLLIERERIEICRKGMVDSRMVIEREKEHECLYETPYGAFSMKIRTVHVNCLETEDKIHARARYTLVMEGDYTADCAVTIRIEPVKAE